MAYVRIMDTSGTETGFPAAKAAQWLDRLAQRVPGEGRLEVLDGGDGSRTEGYVLAIEDPHRARHAVNNLRKYGVVCAVYGTYDEARARPAEPEPRVEVATENAPHRGVAFLRIASADCPRDRVRGMLLVIAAAVAHVSGGDPILRARRFPAGDDAYWVGLNLDAGAMALMAMLRQLGVEYHHARQLPGDDPHPQLQLVPITAEPPAAPPPRSRRRGANQPEEEVGQGFAEARKLIAGFAARIKPKLVQQLNNRRARKKD